MPSDREHEFSQGSKSMCYEHVCLVTANSGCKVKPFIHKRGRPHGSGLGRYRWPVERTLSWLLENKRLGLRYDRCDFIIQSLLQAGCIFLVAVRLAREL